MSCSKLREAKRQIHAFYQDLGGIKISGVAEAWLALSVIGNIANNWSQI